MRWLSLCVVLTGIAFGKVATAGDEAPMVAFRAADDKVTIVIGEQSVAEYVIRDESIPRPYFAHLRTRGGVQVTRNHPPQEGDLQDHAAFHPGLWLAFGDLSGQDSWRLKAKVLHTGFSMAPQSGAGHGNFVAENRYLDESGQRTLCRETRRIAIYALPAGWLLTWESMFSSDNGEFTFGDQEEMGLGVRLATPLAVVAGQGGRMLDNEGRRNERGIWGQAATWVDHRVLLGGNRVGLAVFSHPDNFRPSWRHVRDYGLSVANPFGRKALTGGPESRVAVKPGETLRLRFGVFVYETAVDDDRLPAEMYAKYVASPTRPKH